MSPPAQHRLSCKARQLRYRKGKRKRVEKFMSLAGSGLVDLNWREAELEELREIKGRGRER